MVFFPQLIPAGGNMPRLYFHADDLRNAEGKSQGLTRGLRVEYDSLDITQEGMGLGSVALKAGTVTYFPSTCRTEYLSSSRIHKTFVIDCGSMFTAAHIAHPSLAG